MPQCLIAKLLSQKTKNTPHTRYTKRSSLAHSPDHPPKHTSTHSPQNHLSPVTTTRQQPDKSKSWQVGKLASTPHTLTCTQRGCPHHLNNKQQRHPHTQKGRKPTTPQQATETTHTPAEAPPPSPPPDATTNPPRPSPPAKAHDWAYPPNDDAPTS